MLVYVTSSTTFEFHVSNGRNPEEGWFFKGSFTKWASSPDHVMSNLDQAFVFQFPTKEDGKVDRDNLIVKINLDKCKESDPELVTPLSQHPSSSVEEIVLQRSHPLEAIRTTVASLVIEIDHGTFLQTLRKNLST
jgi:hypothetical protein